MELYHVLEIILDSNGKQTGKTRIISTVVGQPAAIDMAFTFATEHGMAVTTQKAIA